MKHVGHPLFGDASYGGTNILKGEGLPKFRAFVQNCFQVMPRQALHAQSLGFVHPASKKPVSFEADLPPDFSQVLGRWWKYVQAGRSEERRVGKEGVSTCRYGWSAGP